MPSKVRPKARDMFLYVVLIQTLIAVIMCNGCAATANHKGVNEWDRWRNQKNTPDMMSAPAVRLNSQTLKIFHSDWFTINGEKNRDMPTTAPWPDPIHSKSPYVMEFFTPVTPTWVEMRFFKEDRGSTAGVMEGGRWKCDVEAKKCPVSTTENTVRVTLPEKFFSGEIHKFTFQALWDVPPSQRHPGHSDSGAVIATWLYSQK